MPTRRFQTFAWIVLGYSMVVILWGYFLRISESGDGCGTDWPLCHGAMLPAAAEFPTWVEFIHRVSSGVVLLLVITMAVWAFRRLERGHAVRKAAGASLLLTISESLFGALLVVFGLVATDISMARILIRPFHVTNTFLLMAALALTAWWAYRGVKRLPTLRGPGSRTLLVAALALLALAWTGSWTGLAGTAFPTGSVAEGLGQYLDAEHLLIYLRILHPVVAVFAIVIVGRLVLSVVRASAGPLQRRLALVVGALAGAQLILGPMTIALLHPVSLRLAHLLAADLLWIFLLYLGSEVLGQAPVTSGRSSHPPPDSGQMRPGVVQP